MKKLYYFGLLGLLLFEIANVYFIMPIPGSQDMQSIGVAYFLYRWRWVFRVVFGLMALAGLRAAFTTSKWWAAAALAICAYIGYSTNFDMAADTMFYQPQHLVLKNAADNTVAQDRIVIGVEQQGEARAYPIQYLGYHHQVRDTIAGKPIMVTYCTVCRTGRVFEPVVDGHAEQFRLVGMDHFNAMFEDQTTGSWWRQATGEAISGPLKGHILPEMPATQTGLAQWLALFPNSKIMQPDATFQVEYDSMSNYEIGRRTGTLTRKDSVSWQPKSWVAGIVCGATSKAYDWNELQKVHIINDIIDNQPITIVLLSDNKSLFAFKRTTPDQQLQLSQDLLSDGTTTYSLLGVSANAAMPNLKHINVYQEYWHSWKTFHPNTMR